MTLEQLYCRMPLALQRLAVNYEGWRIQRTRFGASFREMLAAVRGREHYSPEQMQEFRDERLSQFIRHAAGHVPYYRRLFQRLGLRPDDFRTMADLAQLPVLTKAEVQDELPEFRAENIRDPRMISICTSGTTGGGLAFPVTLAAWQEQRAVWWRFRERHGLDSREPCLYFGGRTIVPSTQTRPPYWRTNRPGRQILFSGHHLGPQTAELYLDEIERSGYRWLHGYPSMVSLLAHFAVQLNRRIPLRWVSLGAEGVFPQQMAVIEAAFGVKPIAHYGMAEQVANFSLCSAGSLHVDEDFSAVEFQPLGGGEHLILGTNFANPAFPLLRYDVSDVVTLGDAACSCGLPGRIVNRIDGRKDDYVITRSGAMLGRMNLIFKSLVNIREAQILQDQPGHMTLCIVKSQEFTDQDEQRLRAETFQRIGCEMSFDIQYFDRLPRTANGKLRLVVSTVRSGGLTSALQGSVPAERFVA